MTALDPVLIALALLTGALLSRTTVCTIACLREAIVDRRPHAPLRILLLSACAGIVLLSAALVLPSDVSLPVSTPVPGSLLAGAFVLAVGSLVNGACTLGTLSYLARGEFTFLFTLAGTAAVTRLAPAPMQVDVAPAGMHSGALVAAFLPVFAGVAVIAWRVAPRESSPGARRALAFAGAAGAVAGLIYAGHPRWNYTSVLTAVARAAPAPVEWAREWAALALLAGAIVGTFTAGRWRARAPTLVGAARAFAGGALMAYGALLIPGGHDLLLLWSVPGLSLNGVVAYAIVAGTTAASLAAERAWRDRRARPGTLPGSTA